MAAKPFSEESRARTFLRWVRKRTVVSFRQVMPGERVLPHFLLIGAMKSGTTSLFAHLCRHPHVRSAIVKEPRYFDENHERGIDWYRAHFPLARTLSPGDLVGEASTSYIFNPFVADRIREVAPAMKLIAILRNPTERAISHYYHEVEKGRERLSIMQAFEAEEERSRRAERSGDYVGNDFVHFSYKRRGHYRQQLERFLECFPREQLLVLGAEDLEARPDEAVRQVCRFLGLDERLMPADVQRVNVGSERARNRLPEGVRQYLDAHFRPHNSALFDFLGRRFDW